MRAQQVNIGTEADDARSRSVEGLEQMICGRRPSASRLLFSSSAQQVSRGAGADDMRAQAECQQAAVQFQRAAGQ
jgi:hypothetical protein